MGKTPMILGVPMRFVMSWPTCTDFELTGFKLTRHHGDKLISDKQVFVKSDHLPNGGIMYNSEQAAVQDIERAITRIREAAARLGT